MAEDEAASPLRRCGLNVAEVDLTGEAVTRGGCEYEAMGREGAGEVRVAIDPREVAGELRCGVGEGGYILTKINQYSLYSKVSINYSIPIGALRFY